MMAWQNKELREIGDQIRRVVDLSINNDKRLYKRVNHLTRIFVDCGNLTEVQKYLLQCHRQLSNTCYRYLKLS